MVTADQWRGDCLGCQVADREVGTRRPVMTPHLYQPVAESVRCCQAYADRPDCTPQRVTTQTGITASPGRRRGTQDTG